MRGRKDGEDAIAKALLFIFGYQRVVRVVVAPGPASICPVLEIDDSCTETWLDLGKGKPELR